MMDGCKKWVFIAFLLSASFLYAEKVLLYEIRQKQRLLEKYSTREILEELEHRKVEKDVIYTKQKTFTAYNSQE